MILSTTALLAIAGLSTAYRVVPAPDPNVKWLSPGRSVLIKLDVPGLPPDFFDAPTTSSSDSSLAAPSAPPISSLLLNFTLDNRTLLLDHAPFLPLPNPSRPPQISAHEFTNLSAADLDSLVAHDVLGPANLGKASAAYRKLRLSYDRLVTPRDDPGIRYYNHVPRLTLDVLGVTNHFHFAGASPSANTNPDTADVVVNADTILLDVPTQHKILIELSQTPPSSDPKTYAITTARLVARTWPRPQDTYTPRRPAVPGTCTAWSWRCADMGDPPWYRFVWAVEWDGCGRVGSGRWGVCRMGARAGRWAGEWGVLIGGLAVLGLGCVVVSRARRRGGVGLVDGGEEGEGLLDGERGGGREGKVDGDDGLPAHEDVEAGAAVLGGEKDGAGADADADEPPTYNVRMKPLPSSPEQ